MFYDAQAARATGDQQRAATLMGRMPALQQAAAALTVPNAFGALLQRQGAVGLNASTSHVRAVQGHRRPGITCRMAVTDVVFATSAFQSSPCLWPTITHASTHLSGLHMTV